MYFTSEDTSAKGSPTPGSTTKPCQSPKSILDRISHQNVGWVKQTRCSGGASVAAVRFAFLQGVEQLLIGLRSPTKSLCDLDPPYREKCGLGQLRQAIAKNSETEYAIAKGSGISQSVLNRFVHGQRGISLETAAKLCAYLKLELH